MPLLSMKHISGMVPVLLERYRGSFMTIEKLIQSFVAAIIAGSDYEKFDNTYLFNQILGWIGNPDLTEALESDVSQVDTLEMMDTLVTIAEKNGSLDQRQMNRDMLGAQLMNFFVPRPSVVNHRFQQYLIEGPQAATNYFYQLSQKSNYIKTREIAKNDSFDVTTPYGDLEITINLSKPEKDPKKIALAGKSTSKQYPSTALDMNNVGFWGSQNQAARVNHRVVDVVLDGETWGLQYSPYAYFAEHCIVLAKTARPMKVDVKHLKQLMDFVDQFPDYFIGSNADLPIVGGSILSHDHFQAGKHTFPMAKASLRELITIPGIDLESAGIVNWPMSVIRLMDQDQDKLLLASEKIMQAWNNYSDSALSIQATDAQQTRHHTVTPVVRKEHATYVVDLVLRDNNTSIEFPDGIFHPHPDVQHIKKENIGLIEVMGRAILPPRLKRELQDVEQYLLDQPNDIQAMHLAWADQIKDNQVVTPENVHAVVKDAVGHVYMQVLADAGVFKDDTTGHAGFKQFIASI